MFILLILDTDGDGILDDVDQDDDNDGMPDVYEITYGLNPKDDTDASLDGDADELTNLQEFQTGTDPTNPDTDGDGVDDATDAFPLDASRSKADTEDGFIILLPVIKQALDQQSEEGTE